MQKQAINIQDISFSSLFKINFLCGLCFCVTLGVLAFLYSIAFPLDDYAAKSIGYKIGSLIGTLIASTIIGSIVSAIIAAIGVATLRLFSKKIRSVQLVIHQ